MHCPESGLLTNATNIAKVPLLGSLSWSFAPKYVCFGSTTIAWLPGTVQVFAGRLMRTFVTNIASTYTLPTHCRITFINVFFFMINAEAQQFWEVSFQSLHCLSVMPPVGCFFLSSQKVSPLFLNFTQISQSNNQSINQAPLASKIHLTLNVLGIPTYTFHIKCPVLGGEPTVNIPLYSAHSPHFT